MHEIKVRSSGKIKSKDPVIASRRAYGYYCQIKDRHYIILEDAELLHIAGVDTVSGRGGKFITGFVEVNPETVRFESPKPVLIETIDNLLKIHELQGALLNKLKKERGC